MTLGKAHREPHWVRRVVPVVVVWLSFLQACASIPKSHTLVPSGGTDRALQALSLRDGAVVDALTVSGEEHFFFISPSTDQTLTGHVMNPVTGEVLLGQIVKEPFDSLALVYYADPVKRTVDPRSRIPLKPSYPALAIAGAWEQGLPCDTLKVQLDRAEAVRWFARNEGAMAYTSMQQGQRHGLDAAKYTGKAVLVIAVLMGGGNPGDFLPGNSSPADPTESLAIQIGEQNLRWAVTAADPRIIGLLKLRRDKQCDARPTLVAGQSDLQILAALDALSREAAGGASEETTLRQRTQLLDELGPRPLLGDSNRKCGVVDCGLFRGSGNSSQDQRTRVTYERVIWYAGTSKISSIKTMSQGKQGRVVVTDQAITFQETKSGQSSALEIDVPYTHIASVEYKSSNGWDVWRAVITCTDGHTDSVSFAGTRGAAHTEAFAELLNSRIHALDRAATPSAVPVEIAPHY